MSTAAGGIYASRKTSSTYSRELLLPVNLGTIVVALHKETSLLIGDEGQVLLRNVTQCAQNELQLTHVVISYEMRNAGWYHTLEENASIDDLRHNTTTGPDIHSLVQ